ncbi:MAG: hypothetical protein HC919_05010 [Oscillatoriales cyanobacterium SM2_2_1]|nr:hypothetical protein [Oscillatoriales cyanobacterium SM2_2_1]
MNVNLLEQCPEFPEFRKLNRTGAGNGEEITEIKSIPDISAIIPSENL